MQDLQCKEKVVQKVPSLFASAFSVCLKNNQLESLQHHYKQLDHKEAVCVTTRWNSTKQISNPILDQRHLPTDTHVFYSPWSRPYRNNIVNVCPEKLYSTVEKKA